MIVWRISRSEHVSPAFAQIFGQASLAGYLLLRRGVHYLYACDYDEKTGGIGRKADGGAVFGQYDACQYRTYQPREVVHRGVHRQGTGQLFVVVHDVVYERLPCRHVVGEGYAQNETEQQHNPQRPVAGGVGYCKQQCLQRRNALSYEQYPVAAVLVGCDASGRRQDERRELFDERRNAYHQHRIGHLVYDPRHGRALHPRTDTRHEHPCEIEVVVAYAEDPECVRNFHCLRACGAAGQAVFSLNKSGGRKIGRNGKNRLPCLAAVQRLALPALAKLRNFTRKRGARRKKNPVSSRIEKRVGLLFRRVSWCPGRDSNSHGRN